MAHEPTPLLIVFLPVFFLFGVFLLGTIVGRMVEKRHLKDLARREERHRDFILQNGQNLPAGYVASEARLACGSVVISEDAWKKLAARFRQFFGGNILSYELLLERARREANLRLIESARAHGSDAVINLRSTTAELGMGGGKSMFPVGMEVVVFGTGVKLRKETSS